MALIGIRKTGPSTSYSGASTFISTYHLALKTFPREEIFSFSSFWYNIILHCGNNSLVLTIKIAHYNFHFIRSSGMFAWTCMHRVCYEWVKAHENREYPTRDHGHPKINFFSIFYRSVLLAISFLYQADDVGNLSKCTKIGIR